MLSQGKETGPEKCGTGTGSPIFAGSGLKKIWTFREYAPPKTVKKRLPRPIDADVMDEVRRLVNNFESDSEPDTVTLNQLRLHSIQIGRVRID